MQFAQMADDGVASNSFQRGGSTAPLMDMFEMGGGRHGL